MSRPLPHSGLLRLEQVLRILPVSRSHFYEYVRKGLYPKPVMLSPRIPAWRAEEIWALAERGIGPEVAR